MVATKTKQESQQVEVKDGRKHPFFVVDNDLIAVYGPKIGVYGIAVYNVLAYYANKKDMAWPSYQTIADHLDMSRPKVVSTIDALIKCGLIKKEHRFTASGDKTSNTYILVSIHGEGGKQDLPPSKRSEPPGKPQEPPGKQHLPRGGKPQITRGKRRVHEQDPMNKTHSSEQDENERMNDQRAPEPEPNPEPIHSLPAMDYSFLHSNSVTDQTIDYDRSYALLTDPEVRMDHEGADRLARKYGFEHLVLHVFAWRSEKGGDFDTIGALINRVQEFNTRRLIEGDFDSDLFRRHFPDYERRKYTKPPPQQPKRGSFRPPADVDPLPIYAATSPEGATP